MCEEARACKPLLIATFYPAAGEALRRYETDPCEKMAQAVDREVARIKPERGTPGAVQGTIKKLVTKRATME